MTKETESDIVPTTEDSEVMDESQEISENEGELSGEEFS